MTTFTQPFACFCYKTSLGYYNKQEKTLLCALHRLFRCINNAKKFCKCLQADLRRHLNSFAQRSCRHFVVPACYTMFLPKSKKRKQKSVFEMVRKNKANFSKNAGNENFCDCLTTVDNIYTTVCVFLLHKKRL